MLSFSVELSHTKECPKKKGPKKSDLPRRVLEIVFEHFLRCAATRFLSITEINAHFHERTLYLTCLCLNRSLNTFRGIITPPLRVSVCFIICFCNAFCALFETPCHVHFVQCNNGIVEWCIKPEDSLFLPLPMRALFPEAELKWGLRCEWRLSSWICHGHW